MRNSLCFALLVAAAIPLAATAASPAKTPPGTCAITFGPQPIPGDAGHSTTVIHMDVLPGRTANWHTHSAVEYLSLNSGAGTLEFDRAPSVKLRPGKVVTIAANTPHRIHNASTTEHVTWTTFLISNTGTHDYTTLRKGDSAWTPGCPRHT